MFGFADLSNLGRFVVDTFLAIEWGLRRGPERLQTVRTAVVYVVGAYSM